MVEVISGSMFSDRNLLAGYRATSKPPRGSRTGKNFFGLSIGSTASVLGQVGRDVQIRVESGSWKGREGWLDVEGLRAVPTSVQLESGVIDGLSLGRRREIYAELHRVGMLASYEAERLYPLSDMPTDLEASKSRFADHQSYYESLVERWYRSIVVRFSVDRDKLDAIKAEGFVERWPLPDVPKPDRPTSPPLPRNSPAPLSPKPVDPGASAKRAATLVQMGKNLEEDGKTSAALENYRKVVAEFGDTPAAKDAAARIRALAGK